VLQNSFRPWDSDTGILSPEYARAFRLNELGSQQRHYPQTFSLQTSGANAWSAKRLWQQVHSDYCQNLKGLTVMSGLAEPGQIACFP